MTKRMRRRQAEKDFVAALDRLREGKPRNRMLVSRQKAGTLRINPSTVALEAERSRTLIGSSDCKYAVVRELILQAAGRDRSTVASKEEIVAKLKQVIRTQQEELSAARTLLASQRLTIDALRCSNAT